jgi:hypothetical protein
MSVVEGGGFAESSADGLRLTSGGPFPPSVLETEPQSISVKSGLLSHVSRMQEPEPFRREPRQPEPLVNWYADLRLTGLRLPQSSLSDT